MVSESQLENEITLICLMKGPRLRSLLCGQVKSLVLFSLFPGPSVGFGREGGGPAGSQSLERESQSESDPLSLSLSPSESNVYGH